MADSNTAGNGTGIPNLDGANESTLKSRSKPKSRTCSMPGCFRKTIAAGGICATCKGSTKDNNKPNSENGDNKKEKKAKKKAAKNKPVVEDGIRDNTQDTVLDSADEVEHDNCRLSSTLVTLEPSVDSFQDVIDSLGSPSPFVATPGRRNVYSQPASSTSPQLQLLSPLTPGNLKTEAFQQGDASSPTLLNSDSSYARPIIEIPTSTPRKRDFDEAGLSTPEIDEGDIHHDETSHKHRKIAPTTEPETNSATEAGRIKSFEDAMAAEVQAQEDQLVELKRAQLEQLEAIEAARIMQTNTRSAAMNDFLAGFKILQESRDYFESEMLGWKDNYTHLEDVLKTTEIERDNWITAKEQLDGEKADVEKERDEWKEAKEKVDEEKAAVEQTRRDADAANAEEISMLKEKLGKVKKRKAELVKMMAGDSD